MDKLEYQIPFPNPEVISITDLDNNKDTLFVPIKSSIEIKENKETLEWEIKLRLTTLDMQRIMSVHKDNTKREISAKGLQLYYVIEEAKENNNA